MQWINPRDRLPEHEQLVWALKINKREEDNSHPSAEIILAIAHRDQFGVMLLDEIDECGGRYGNTMYFYGWNYRKIFSEKEWYVRIGDFVQKDEVWDRSKVTAWCPYEGLPTWEFIDVEESITILRNSDEFNKEYKSKGMYRGPEQLNFISIDEALPPHGICLVMSGGTMWLCIYKGEDPWIGPKGEPVEAWFLVPQRYYKK